MVRRSNAKTISLVRSKNPMSFFQLIPHLQCCKPINCCFIFLPQPGQTLLLVPIVFVMPFFQDCLYLCDQLLLVWHIEDIAGCKDIVGQTAQRIFRRNTVFIGTEDNADRRVIIMVIDLRRIVVEVHIQLSGSLRRQLFCF